MKLKRFKWASPLFILSLAIAGLFGVSSAVIANQKVNDEPVMEKADATAGDIYYYRGSKSSWNVDSSKPIVEGSSTTWSLTKDEKFKLSSGGDNWTAPSIRGEPVQDSAVWGGNGDDIGVNTTGSYRLQLNSTNDLEFFYTTSEGSMTVDLGYAWGDSACNIAIYFWNGTSSGWSSYYSVSAGSACINIFYGLNFVPTNMLLVRYNSSNSESSWRASRWANKLSQTGDLDYSSNGRVVITGNDSAELNTYPVVKGGIDSWSDLATLGYFKINGSWHAEYYSVVNLSSEINFKIVFFNNQYYGDFSAPSEISSNFSNVGDNNDIHVTTGGTFVFFFDSKNHSTYITTPALMTADWGSYFLSSETGMVCNASGSVKTNRWGSLSSHFATLSVDVQYAFAYVDANTSGGTGEQAAARYDYIVHKYGTSTYPDFAGRISSGKLSASAINRFNPLDLFGSDDNNITTIIIVVASSVALLSVTALSILVIKKRKHKEQE